MAFLKRSGLMWPMMIRRLGSLREIQWKQCLGHVQEPLYEATGGVQATAPTDAAGDGLPERPIRGQFLEVDNQFFQDPFSSLADRVGAGLTGAMTACCGQCRWTGDATRPWCFARVWS